MKSPKQRGCWCIGSASVCEVADESGNAPRKKTNPYLFTEERRRLSPDNPYLRPPLEGSPPQLHTSHTYTWKDRSLAHRQAARNRRAACLPQATQEVSEVQRLAILENTRFGIRGKLGPQRSTPSSLKASSSTRGTGVGSLLTSERGPSCKSEGTEGGLGGIVCL